MSPLVKFVIIVGNINDVSLSIKYKIPARIGEDNCHLFKYKMYCKINFFITLIVYILFINLLGCKHFNRYLNLVIS